ncbi:MAG: SMP-30/gluconolactonase/LRE family protein [Anaerolineales bacterium]|nr:SMP-30/gluconolactonase/LRE family protein [Anaerolineales bacterium]
MQAQLIFDAQATLGEGPTWDAKTQTLYWVDILSQKIYAGADLLAELDQSIGFIAPCKNGNLVVGKRSSFVEFNLHTQQETLLATLATEPATNRVNDGKCDPAGRLLAGTMDNHETDPSGTLYSYDGKQVTPLIEKVTISNGLTWSPDYKTLYYIDTPTRIVRAYEYDRNTGQIANPRTALQIDSALGWPDGMTSDMDGNLWIALWGGAQVTKWNPHSGKLLEQIAFPALQPSCPVFGGKDRNELYVTSARKGMSEPDLKKYPLSGGLFKVETRVTGIPTFEFNH